MNSKMIHRALALALLLISFNVSAQIDGMILIPAGEYTIGKNGTGDCHPAHTVQIDSFYMDTHEVTNADYKIFCQETGCQLPEFFPTRHVQQQPPPGGLFPGPLSL